MQSPGSPRSADRRRRRRPSASEQAAASRPSASERSGERAVRSSAGHRGHGPPERVQGGHHARLQRRGEVVLAGASPTRRPRARRARRRCRAGRRRPPPRRSATVAATGTSGSIVSTPRAVELVGDGGDATRRPSRCPAGSPGCGPGSGRRRPTARPGSPATPRTRRTRVVGREVGVAEEPRRRRGEHRQPERRDRGR